MEPLSGAASVIAVIQLTGTIIQICGAYISKVKDAKDDIIRLQQNIRALAVVLEALDNLLREPKGSEMSTLLRISRDIVDCSSSLTTIKKKIDPERTQKQIRRWGLRAIKWPLKRTDVDKAVSDIERYKALFSLALQIDQTKTTGILSQKVNLNRLQVAKGAAFNDYETQHAVCLPGTRVELLRDIDNWTKMPSGKCIFWLNGMAGTGKSTISRTVAGRLEGKNLLAASFFFKRGEQDRGNAKMLFSTLAKQVGSTIPQLRPGIQKAIEDDPDISERVLSEQFDKLILQPLLAIKQGPAGIIVIVIDALDECDQEDDIRVILRLLPRVQTSSSLQLRFLLTSRPELPIRLGFKGITNDHQDLILHKIPKPVIEHDITLYFKNKFLELRQERELPSEWPGDVAINTLVERAAPLFISATTLYRFISDKKRNPEKRLRAILSDEMNYASKMDSTYLPVLDQLLTGQNEREIQQLVEEFKNIVGVIILLATPLSVHTLSRLMSMELIDIQTHLDLFYSVLDVPSRLDEPVRILHLSFRDFLLDDLKKETPFWINEREVHHKLTTQCLEVMRQERHGLRKNICNIADNATQRSEIDRYAIDRCLPPDLQYACRYWVHHLVQSHDPANELRQAFSFLQSHLLHWIEAMSLLDIISEVPGVIQRLQSIAQNAKDFEISELLYDAWRFILKNRQIAETAPLQLYSTGLIFAPKNSVIRKTFERELSTWSQLPRVEETWSGELQALEGHYDTVRSVAFSPNGQLLASGSFDKTIKLWNASIGELRQTLEGHSGSVCSVVFSPDAQLLASGSYDKTIKLWDVSTGELRQTLEGHYALVRSLAFSPDAQLLASGSYDKTIKLWDVSTGELRQTLEDHSDSVRSVAFSPDGQLLATGSFDKTIKLWDVSTGELRQTLEGHSDSVRSVAFSPDGQLLASGSDDKTIKLWDASTGELRQTLDGHSSLVSAVAFSPDGQLLASGSDDKTIGLWNAITGGLRQTLDGHSGAVRSVAFSPNGQLLASVSYDNTINFWDSSTGELRQTLEGHSHWVWAGTHIDGLSMLENQWIYFQDKRILWLPPNYRPSCLAFNAGILALGHASGPKVEEKRSPELQTLEGHSHWVWSVAFSQDGQLLASGSEDKTIKLWDPTTGALKHTLEGHSDSVWSVAFSQDRQLLASGSDDKTIKLWDPITGALKHTLDGHSDSILSVAFSQDRRLLASGSCDRTIKLWNPITGALKHTLDGHSDSVWSLAFSQDGQLLASGSCDRTIKLWNPTTGALKHTLDGHSDWVWSAAFSQDGQLLASGSDDKTIKLWDPTTGALKHTLEGHSDPILSVAFSQDGQLLASGSDDETTSSGILPLAPSL
ncbi:hypothetical protein CNMCM6457_005979 [Aspergillus fumigatiaffinis]|nr:hypothetical protein CNMCM6457_005979 [Aspergillus fumigatiaffinis]